MESDGYNTDDGKRKRDPNEIGEEAKLFGKSKKVGRTPTKPQQEKREEKLDSILSMMQNLTEEIKQMRKEQRIYNEEINTIKKENALLKEENENMKRENNDIRKNMQNSNDRLERLEREKK